MTAFLAFILGYIAGMFITAFQILVVIGKAAAKRDALKKTGGAP